MLEQSYASSWLEEWHGSTHLRLLERQTWPWQSRLSAAVLAERNKKQGIARPLWQKYWAGTRLVTGLPAAA